MKPSKPCAGPNPTCARGVRHAAVLGSVARGDSRPDSEIDIMIEIDPEAHLTALDYPEG
jgi:predicted nucleotidyltransferase